MNSEPNSNFLDPKNILAFALVGLFFFWWQARLTKKYPEHFNKTKIEQTKDSLGQATGETNTSAANNRDKFEPSLQAGENSPVTISPSEPLFTEEFFEVETDNWKAKFSNKGLSLVEFSVKTYSSSEGGPLQFLNLSKFKERLFETQVLGFSDLFFDVVQNGNSLKGSYENDSFSVSETIKWNADGFTFDVETKVLNKGNLNSVRGLEYIIPSDLGYFPFMNETKNSSLGRTEKRRVVYSDGTKFHDAVLSNKKNFNLSNVPASIMGLDWRYFTIGLKSFSEVIPVLTSSKLKTDQSYSKWIFNKLNNEPIFNVKYKQYIGPKDMKMLELADPDFKGFLNFGFLSFLSRPMLKVLQFFYGKVHNWGIAIILLTLLIRLLILPFAMSSLKSMKKMQEVQPILKEYREKYKDKPEMVTQKTMELMKGGQFNPVAGCLPMLLQIPIIFAFYRMLSESVVLFQAPFMGWIKDLSVKDPLFVLPLIMAVCLVIQQKITPTTMDPKQAKLMMFMPLLFLVFLVSTPSGLTLYFSVSSLFGLGQQVLFNRLKASA